MRMHIPYANFAVTAMVLHEDDLRWTIDAAEWLSAAIRGVFPGYRGHPDVQAWKRHLDALHLLHDCCIRQVYWRDKTTTREFRLGDTTPSLPGYSVPQHIGDFKFHALERARLREKRTWYDQWGWTDEPGRI